MVYFEKNCRETKRKRFPPPPVTTFYIFNPKIETG